MTLKTRLISITGINFIQNYIKIENSYFHNIFRGLVLFDQINANIGEQETSFKNI